MWGFPHVQVYTNFCKDIVQQWCPKPIWSSVFAACFVVCGSLSQELILHIWGKSQIKIAISF